MVKHLQILAVLLVSLIELKCLSYGQQYSASLGRAPVGFISRHSVNGEKEVYSSLGNAKVGVYKKQNFPIQPNYLRPIVRPVYYPQYIPVYRPVYQPIIRPVYQPIYRPVYQPINKPVYQPINKPVYQPINKPGYKSVIKPKPKPSGQYGGISGRSNPLEGLGGGGLLGGLDLGGLLGGGGGLLGGLLG